MKHEFSTIREVLQDLRDMETKEDIEKMHLCNLPTASAGFAALGRIEARVAELEEHTAGLEATIKRDMGGDYLSLQALYINQLGVVRGHEQDRAKVQAALGNGANEDLWQPGTSWVDAAIRAIQHYENHLQC